ncbi:hypothetical protein [Oceanicoccus sagamiensis]|uniref:DUF2846 domain-containing protein n=1 Tax=Oceanicoccus sagamiensis TaxID=716816 RepID=A0A1X9NF49_9GAMM|nr:hypothetical protein [Oceanicoccus sagamiensis]ARN72653.1 hypothetical protein BST96_00100 [Oceanicoccus sagamiensis]
MRGCFLLLFIASLIGCAASGPKFSEQKFDKNPEYSEIFIFRENQFADGGTCYEMRVDEKGIGVLANGGFLRYEMLPGSHKLAVPMVDNNQIALRFDSNKDQATYIQLHPALNKSNVIPASEIIAESTDFNYSGLGLALRFNYALAQVTEAYALERLGALADSSVNPSCMATLRIDQ